ncbi:Rho GTPase-activating protein 17 [Thelohanellus kitauei]|uniref:Rho GTPase-activating protein 17 n=1 Tax=Thelohanellus kitauei TaxID=669202 RepID=A0A0C2I868_THEKT|nr:Rho GTPase-activating protein 17 [Thelohanellus kitauei]
MNDSQKKNKDQGAQDKLDSIEKEVENALTAFDCQQDIFATEVLNFISHEKTYADIYISILEASRDYHKNCFDILDQSLAEIRLKSESTTRQPVFGLSLIKYKEIFGNELSYVIEECCEYLNANGLESEGLFRISGSQYKVKKLIVRDD